MYAVERQEAIAQLVAERSTVSVAELAGRFEVTTETIRRDLDLLQREQLVRRVHGGAVKAHGLAALEVLHAHQVPGFNYEDVEVAVASLPYVPEAGGSVILAAGRRVERLAALWPAHSGVRTFTNSLPAANILAEAEEPSLYVLPGSVSTSSRAVTCESTLAALADLRVDVAFVEADGITAGHGLSARTASDASLRRAIVTAGRQVVALVGSDGVGTDSDVRYAGLSDVDVVITAAGAPPDRLQELRDAGVAVVVASMRSNQRDGESPSLAADRQVIQSHRA